MRRSRRSIPEIPEIVIRPSARHRRIECSCPRCAAKRNIGSGEVGNRWLVHRDVSGLCKAFAAAKGVNDLKRGIVATR